MARIHWTVWLLLLLQQPLLHATELRIRTVYASSTGVSDIEVTVRSLETATSPQRFLTDSSGSTRTFPLTAGLYQVIAIGKGFVNSVKEAFINDSTKEIVLEMRTRPNVDVIEIKNQQLSSSSGPVGGAEKRVRLQFLSSPPQKAPIARARVLVRDSEGNGERWTQTDATGSIAVDLPKEPAFLVLPMIVLPIDGKIYNFVLLQDCSESKSYDSLGIYPQDATCVSIKSSFAEIEIPIPTPTSSGQTTGVR